MDRGLFIIVGNVSVVLFDVVILVFFWGGRVVIGMLC